MAKKEKYRLEALLKIKLRQKREAEISLARAIRILEDEKNLLQSMEDTKAEILRKKEKSRTDLNEKIASGQSTIKQSHFHLGYMTKIKEDEDKIAAEISEQEETVSVAQEKLGRARRNYIDAAGELNVMEKHKELWTKKVEKRLTATENKQLGELANVMHQINKMKDA